MQHAIRRALISVFDKTGIVDLARALSERGVEVLSSGGTARLLREQGVPVQSVSDLTRFPEMLDGRVKTLHPAVHGGILARRSLPEHMSDIERAGIGPIDLVVVNFYPFEKTVADPSASLADAVEMIDIGGPAMVRSAAKNHAHVGVVVDPADYGVVREEFTASGGLSEATRRRLALVAFRRTAEYDRAVQAHLASCFATPDAGPGTESGFDDTLRVELTKVRDLRYGENPHQRAAFYRMPGEDGPSVASAESLQGKPLSFNNILDFDAALALVAEFAEPACVIFKHGNPCGAALGADVAEAFGRALECDPVSAFGGVIACNRTLEREAAERIAETFFEGLIAPGFDDGARNALARKKKLRLLAVGDPSRFSRAGYDLRRVTGGMLAQDWDRSTERVRDGEIATKRAPNEDEWRALELGWILSKHVKSNAIVYALPDRAAGIGAGQMSRVDSARIAREKARVSLRGAAMASDAFFPFRDAVDAAAEAGIAAVVQPGGSIRDREVIDAADEHGMTMVLTGHRHFRH